MILDSPQKSLDSTPRSIGNSEKRLATKKKVYHVCATDTNWVRVPTQFVFHNVLPSKSNQHKNNIISLSSTFGKPLTLIKEKGSGVMNTTIRTRAERNALLLSGFGCASRSFSFKYTWMVSNVLCPKGKNMGRGSKLMCLTIVSFIVRFSLLLPSLLFVQVCDSTPKRTKPRIDPLTD